MAKRLTTLFYDITRTMSMSPYWKFQIRKKVLHEYYSLDLIFQWCNKFKPPWMLLSKQINDFFQTDQRLLPDQCLLDRGCAYKQLLCREYYLGLATERSWNFSYPQRQRTSNSFLYFTKAKTRIVESVSRACQLFHSIFKFTKQSVQLVMRKKQYWNNTIDSLCF